MLMSSTRDCIRWRCRGRGRGAGDDDDTVDVEASVVIRRLEREVTILLFLRRESPICGGWDNVRFDSEITQVL